MYCKVLLTDLRAGEARSLRASYIAIVIFCCPLSCGIASDSQLLTIEILGVDQAPEAASGDTTPIAIEMLPAGVAATIAGESVPLAAIEDLERITVIDRPQIFFESDIKTYEGSEFSQVAVTFAAEITVSRRDASDLEGSLETVEVTLAQVLPVETGKDIALEIQLQWADIISEDSLTSPTMQMSKL